MKSSEQMDCEDHQYASDPDFPEQGIFSCCRDLADLEVTTYDQVLQEDRLEGEREERQPLQQLEGDEEPEVVEELRPRRQRVASAKLDQQETMTGPTPTR